MIIFVPCFQDGSTFHPSLFLCFSCFFSRQGSHRVQAFQYSLLILKLFFLFSLIRPSGMRLMIFFKIRNKSDPAPESNWKGKEEKSLKVPPNYSTPNPDPVSFSKTVFPLIHLLHLFPFRIYPLLRSGVLRVPSKPYFQVF